MDVSSGVSEPHRAGELCGVQTHCGHVEATIPFTPQEITKVLAVWDEWGCWTMLLLTMLVLVVKMCAVVLLDVLTLTMLVLTLVSLLSVLVCVVHCLSIVWAKKSYGDH